MTTTAADRVPGDFGSRLRDARERQGILLRQVANATKISVGVLEALERNDISKLPGGIFSRAFIRSYALEVGLDPDQTVQDFIAQFPHEALTAPHAKAQHVEEHEVVETDRRMARTFLRLMTLSLPIAAVVLYFGTVGRSVSAPAVRQPAPAVAPAPVAAPPVSPTAAEVQPAVVTASAPASPDVLKVTIAARRVCWVSATADGQKAIDRLLQPGEEHTIEARREFVITAGDGSAIALTLNGADARPLGKPGQVARATLTLNNYKDYLVTR